MGHHYSNVTWASWHLKSPTTRPLVVRIIVPLYDESRWPLDSPNKWPFHDVIVFCCAGGWTRCFVLDKHAAWRRATCMMYCLRTPVNGCISGFTGTYIYDTWDNSCCALFCLNHQLLLRFYPAAIKVSWYKYPRDTHRHFLINLINTDGYTQRLSFCIRMSYACLCRCNVQYLLWCLVHVYVVLCMYMWWWCPNRNLIHCRYRP